MTAPRVSVSPPPTGGHEIVCLPPAATAKVETGEAPSSDPVVRPDREPGHPDPVVAHYTPFAADIARLVADADGWEPTQRLAEQTVEP